MTGSGAKNEVKEFWAKQVHEAFDTLEQHFVLLEINEDSWKRLCLVNLLPQRVRDLLRPALEEPTREDSYGALKRCVLHLLFGISTAGKLLPLDYHSALAEAQAEFEKWRQDDVAYPGCYSE